ncbi:hypothetical protein COMNV_01629 [Commensalibacter sp. Nvir]|uniref:hypothetical protein n=1 Tax=Commensalibacter sp. Nvir TaxID=3069817 RepID=UPI002D2554DE|nr:hypothetical protein COMNV_01629 [Commensalibacter sp. Nvir]
MATLEKNQPVVKIRFSDWEVVCSQNLSLAAKEVLLTINSHIFFSKKNPEESYWYQITFQQFVELTELNVDQINDAFDELISKNILEKTNNIITLTTERCVHSAGGHSHA